MTELEHLIAAVERGDVAWGFVGAPYRWALGDDWPIAMDACNGSLDAAHRLHDALLPGWAWGLESANAADVWNAAPWPEGGLWTSIRAYSDEGNTARAWLLAILRATAASRATVDTQTGGEG